MKFPSNQAHNQAFEKQKSQTEKLVENLSKA